MSDRHSSFSREDGFNEHIEVKKRGWLTKEGGKFPRKWQKRYFVLTNHDLRYFRSQHDHKPAGTITFRGQTVSVEDNSSKKEFAFNVVIPNRTYYICAPNREERDEWMSSIREAVTQDVEEVDADDVPKSDHDHTGAAVADEESSAAEEAAAGDEGEKDPATPKDKFAHLSNEELLQLASKLYSSGKVKDAIERFVYVADVRNDPQAQYNMGWFCSQGQVVDRDHKKAFDYYLRAAEQGYASAAFNIGVLYAQGKGVERDYAKVLEWYTRAAESGDVDAQYNLGAMYISGQGVNIDVKKGIEWLEKAAEQGQPKAIFSLGEIYEGTAEHSVGKDIIRSAEWYLKAASYGEERAQGKLGMYMDELETLANDAGNERSSSASYVLGCMLRYGYGVEKRGVDAVKFFKRAAEGGNVHAQFTLGEMFRNGDTVDRQYQTAAEWYRRAAEQGYALAQHNLGYMYNQGIGVDENFEEAVKWYKLAARQGTVQSQFDLGVSYMEGEGVEVDRDEALKWYMEAAKKSYPPAMHSIGVMYKDGCGVERDAVTALSWFIRANALGHDESSSSVRQLERQLTEAEVRSAQMRATREAVE